jgi:3-deoxy-D-manno-octulosonic-acid transferase
VLKISVFFYDLFIWLYNAAIMLASYQNEKAARWLEGRKNLLPKIRKALELDEERTNRIWMHCASLGEFEQGRPVLEASRKTYPDALIILTFFSPSGYETRKNYPNADHVFYLPADTKSNAREFLDVVRPTLVIFVKYDFWYHYFKEVQKSGALFILISAVFRKRQPFFQWYGVMHREMLSALTHIFVQDENSMQLLQKRGFRNMSRTNDTRIDRVMNIAANAKQLPTLEMFLAGEKALIGGSVYETENDYIHKAWKENLIPGKIVLVPHEVDNAHIEKISEAWGEQAILYSKFNEKEAINKKVLIVDTVGLLSNIYWYGSMAIVGGGFGKTVHNTLEPAAFGIPILFGPKFDKFMEAVEMVSSGAAYTFSSYEELTSIFHKMNDPELRKESGAKAAGFIRSHTGGTDEIMEYIRKSLD